MVSFGSGGGSSSGSTTTSDSSSESLGYSSSTGESGSTADSTSESYSTSTSDSNSYSTDASTSASDSYGVSSSESSQDIWDEQSEYLTSLYAAGDELVSYDAGETARAFIDEYADLANSTIEGVGDTAFLDSILDGSNTGMESLMQFMSADGNPYLESVIEDMKASQAEDMNIFGMSENRTDANMYGNFGSSRHGIDDYMTRNEAMNIASEAETAMRMGAYNEDMNRALSASNSYIDTLMSADTNLQSQYGNTLNAIFAAYGLNMAPYDADWLSIENMAELLGDPTILTDSLSSSENVSSSEAESYGISESVSDSLSESVSTSDSSSESYSLDESDSYNESSSVSDTNSSSYGDTGSSFNLGIGN